MNVSQIDNWFTYHPVKGDQIPKYAAIRGKAKELALLINELVPDSADKSAAIRLLREAVMTANAGIACATEAPFEQVTGG